jgi:hypothetical protein
VDGKTWTTPVLETLDISGSTQQNYPAGGPDTTAPSDYLCVPGDPPAFCLTT